MSARLVLTSGEHVHVDEDLGEVLSLLADGAAGQLDLMRLTLLDVGAVDVVAYVRPESVAAVIGLRSDE